LIVKVLRRGKVIELSASDALRTATFYQVPQIAIQIFKDGDRAVSFLLRLSLELYPQRPHFIVVTPKIIRFQEEKDAPARLIPNKFRLLRR
jgi:uncharacterized protein (DUF2384 family)